MSKYICIHGHFYQPPRENPWLEEVELQESAEPFHDWNERITAECYNPNGVSRILDGDGKIVDIVNNYAKISFNFGPTLLSWMKDKAPKSYQYILEGDKQSLQRFNGHGSAMAQVYNHIIMPLANRRDKETQIIWGLEDFKRRFGREAEGMWLAETAVDTESLELLVEHGIKFTVLAPNQAKRYRSLGEQDWLEGVNPKHHYICRLPSGKKIVLFFYDGDVSQAVAFKGLLKDGKEFANYLVGNFSEEMGDQAQLVHIATDGESYGHHHRHGDMALAYCLQYIEENDLARITNYSEYMSLVAPTHEVEIYEDSSWSCAHGVERWKSNCGCSTGGRLEWNQAWRTPLRNALDWLRDELIEVYESEMALFHPDPWKIRNAYISVLMNRAPENLEKFFEEYIQTELSEHGKTRVMRLLEMQRYSLLMFTSCAWFFDEISGIETVQVLQYANRAIQLGERVSDHLLEPEFLDRLQEASSNLPEHGNGAEIYQKFTTPARLTLTKVGMHYAVASLFADNPGRMSIMNYDVANQYFERLEAGIQRMAIGRTTVFSKITLSQKYFSFVVVYLGQHQIIGSSSNQLSRKDFDTMRDKVREAFNMSNLSDALQIMQTYFPSKNFSIWDLFKDERIKVLNQILSSSMDDAEDAYHNIYDRNYNLMNVMRSANLPIPPMLRQNLEIVINKDIEGFFNVTSSHPDRLHNLVNEVGKWSVSLNHAKISHVAEHNLYERIQNYYHQEPENFELIHHLNRILECLYSLSIYPDLNEIQNLVFRMSHEFIPQWNEKMEKETKYQEAKNYLLRLCELTNLRIEE